MYAIRFYHLPRSLICYPSAFRSLECRAGASPWRDFLPSVRPVAPAAGCRRFRHRVGAPCPAQRRPILRGAEGTARAWFTVPLSFLEICFLFQCGGSFGGLPRHGGLLRRHQVACVQLCSLRVALVSWESSETAGRLMTALGRFLIGEYREAEGQGR